MESFAEREAVRLAMMVPAERALRAVEALRLLVVGEEVVAWDRGPADCPACGHTAGILYFCRGGSCECWGCLERRVVRAMKRAVGSGVVESEA